jgi:hypothetical protein
MAVPIVVQHAGDTTYGSSPRSKAFTSPNTGGNVLIAFAWVRFLSGTPTLTDTAGGGPGNTWVLQSQQPLSEGGQCTSLLFICTSCLAGSNTVSLNFGGGSLGVLDFIAEISGSGGIVDQIVSGHNASPSTPYTCPSITTTKVDSLVLACFQTGVGAAGGPSIASPYVRLSNPVTGNTYSAGGAIGEASLGTYSAQVDQPGDDVGYILFNIYPGAPPLARAKPSICVVTG